VVRKLTFAFAILFGVVVAMGYVPRFIQLEGDQRLMFGLFQISLIDDITHGVTALAALIASLTSRKLSLLFLTAFGFYYALDAIFFLTYGFFNDKPYSADIMLNLPHVLISTIMLGTVYWLAPKVDPLPA
jgi:Zn-dependent protease